VCYSACYCFIYSFLSNFEDKFRYDMLSNCFLMYYHCTEVFYQNREFGLNG
jgi:hypothetical protein